ncbi:hypothetical protein PoB_001063000 [Plakobranchus ocellatus]|uniref:THD domain-containing protein n=1 Tax=Plakobranchus ocellatus TaxID=259542 RepID=A0AAV3YLZ2_9GAST|nr:hypothetical protein PoB_001063000 [Plakobranchus ocellatus]
MKETKVVLKQGVLHSLCPVNLEQIEKGQSAGSKHSSHMETDPRYNGSQSLFIATQIATILAFGIFITIIVAGQKTGLIFSPRGTKTDTTAAAPEDLSLAEFQQSHTYKNQSLSPLDEAAGISTTPAYPYLKGDGDAHLLLNVEETIRKKSSVWWTEPVSGYTCFIGSGLRYDDGRLQVLQAGEFFAYSDISFSALDNTIPHNWTSIFVFASMQRNHTDSSGNTTVLSPNVRRLTLKKGEEKTLRFNEILRLKKDEWIGMYISHPSLLKDVTNGNSFGLLRRPEFNSRVATN